MARTTGISARSAARNILQRLIPLALWEMIPVYGATVVRPGSVQSVATRQFIREATQMTLPTFTPEWMLSGTTINALIAIPMVATLNPAEMQMAT